VLRVGAAIGAPGHRCGCGGILQGRYDLEMKVDER
jgi:hypothetical protein